MRPEIAGEAASGAVRLGAAASAPWATNTLLMVLIFGTLAGDQITGMMC